MTHFVGGGTARAIRPLESGNDLTAVCVSRADGRLHLMFGINGTVVDDVVVAGTDTSGWLPAVVSCSCEGPEESRFTNLIRSRLPVDG